MLLKLWQFSTIMFVALSMSMAFCHLLEMPVRLHYDPALWSRVTNSAGVREIELDRKPASAQTIIYNLHGDNSRVNISSYDASLNIVNIEQQKLFADLRQTINENVSEPSERERLFECTNRLEKAPDKSSFARTYAEFMALAADHMAVFLPFLPALQQFMLTLAG